MVLTAAILLDLAGGRNSNDRPKVLWWKVALVCSSKSKEGASVSVVRRWAQC